MRQPLWKRLVLERLVGGVGDRKARLDVLQRFSTGWLIEESARRPFSALAIASD